MAGKKYLEALKSVEKGRTYSYKDGVSLAKKINFVKFDASVEVNFYLNVDPRQADQNIRGAVVLPHGTGKTHRILVVTNSSKEKEALEAGATHAGGKELLDKIKGGWFDFDIIVATPDMMAELGKLGKILGPKGLMPNPKTGTVTMDVVGAIKSIQEGRVEYRVDKEGNINVLIGKVSFSDEQLADNFKAIYDAILKAKPAAVKGTYIKNLVVSTTMGPGISVSVE